MIIKALGIERESLDVRSSGNAWKRVDAYFVAYLCPPDKVNLDKQNHEWICRFEVPRGSAFQMQDYASKDAANAARGYIL